MTDGPVWHERYIQYQDQEIVFDNPYEPWHNVTETTRTFIASTREIQHALFKKLH